MFKNVFPALCMALLCVSAFGGDQPVAEKGTFFGASSQMLIDETGSLFFFEYDKENTLKAIGADGTDLWSLKLEGYPIAQTISGGDLILAVNITSDVYHIWAGDDEDYPASSPELQILAVNAASGAVSWQASVAGNFQDWAVSNNIVYVRHSTFDFTSFTENLSAIQNGENLWDRNLRTEVYEFQNSDDDLTLDLPIPVEPNSDVAATPNDAPRPREIRN